MNIIKKMLPEKIPAIAAIFYNLIPARMFIPHYKMIAGEINLPENSLLLDIGTGPGLLPIEIAKKYPSIKIIGMDLSEKMIEIANKNKRKSGDLLNVEFKVMDAKALEFKDNSLDMVISTGSLHHWKDPVKIFDEIHRCLKVGAYAWIYDGYAEAADADIKKYIKKIFWGFPPVCLVKSILGIHGFSQEGYDTLIKDWVARSKFKTCIFQKRGIMMRLEMKK